MSKHRILVIFPVLILALFILVACQQETPSPTPMEAVEAVPEPVATVAVDTGSGSESVDNVSEVNAVQAADCSAQCTQRDFRYIVVAHGNASSDFWATVIAGVQDASADMGVQVEYYAPDTFDLQKMADLIGEAAATNPDGLVVSVPDVNALGDAIKAVSDAGIPVFTINSGSEYAEQVGAIAHVGQLEYQAGYKAGEQMLATGANRAACINSEVGNIALDLRCQGFSDSLSAAGITTAVLVAEYESGDAAGAKAAVMAALDAELAANPETDAVLTLSHSTGMALLEGLHEADTIDSFYLGTFDFSPEILQAIQEGDFLFAIDQQPYLQGYLPIVYLTLFLENLNVPGGSVILTGPSVITEENAASILELDREGTR